MRCASAIGGEPIAFLVPAVAESVAPMLELKQCRAFDPWGSRRGTLGMRFERRSIPLQSRRSKPDSTERNPRQFSFGRGDGIMPSGFAVCGGVEMEGDKAQLEHANQSINPRAARANRRGGLE